MSEDKKKRISKGRVWGITSASVLALIVAMLLSLSLGGYKADDVALKALGTNDKVTVTEADGEVVFLPSNSTSGAGIVFYPGGKVEYTAYAPLLQCIAEKGITCILVEMPFDYAFLGVNAADEVMEEFPEIGSWYIAGHSLGGAFGSIYAAEHSDKIDGVILLGAYSTKPLTDLRVLSIYGSEDGVINRENYVKYKSNLPSDVTELIIEGGNHAMFGSYGVQKGDGQATIESEMQWKIVSESISGFILE